MRQNDGVGQISDVYLCLPPLTRSALSIILFGSRFADLVFTAWSSPRCHTATYGVPLSKAYEMHCQRRSGDPTWVMLPSLNKRQGPCPKLPTSRT
jgi:hypothetical protein